MSRRPVRIGFIVGASSRANRWQGLMESAGFEVSTILFDGDRFDPAPVNPSDIIVVDPGPSRIHAYELCQAIRRDLEVRDVPFVVLLDREEYRDRKWYGWSGDSDGNDYVLAKPCSPTQLLRLLDEIVTERSLQLGRSQPAFPTRVVWPTARRRGASPART